MSRQRLNELLSEYKHAAASVKAEVLTLLDAEENELVALEAQKVVQDVSLLVQQGVHSKIAAVVTRCMEAVFVDPYEFKITFVQKRNKTEANLVFERRGLVATDPMFEVPGGVLDVAAFALRIACLVLEKPIKRRLLVLDEPFSKVRGERNRERMRNLVEMLARDFGLQILINIDVDVYPEFLMGTVVELGAS